MAVEEQATAPGHLEACHGRGGDMWYLSWLEIGILMGEAGALRVIFSVDDKAKRPEVAVGSLVRWCIACRNVHGYVCVPVFLTAPRGVYP